MALSALEAPASMAGKHSCYRRYASRYAIRDKAMIRFSMEERPCTPSLGARPVCFSDSLVLAPTPIRSPSGRPTVKSDRGARIVFF
jgi:hypothetical protein